MNVDEILKEVENFVDSYQELFERIEFVVGVSRGGLIPAVWLATRANKPLVTAYIDKQDNVYFDRIDWVQDKRVIVVDDICRTGKTIIKVADFLIEKGVKEVCIYTVFSLTDKLKYPFNTRLIEKDIKMPWDYE